MTKHFFSLPYKREKKSLGTVVVLCLICAQAISLILVIGSAYVISERAIRSQSMVLLGNQFQQVDQDLSRILESVERSTGFLKQMVDTGSLDPSALRSVEMTLFSVLRASPEITNAFSVRPDGSYVQVMRQEGSPNFTTWSYDATVDRVTVYERDPLFHPISRTSRALLPREPDPRRLSVLVPREPDFISWNFTRNNLADPNGGVASVAVLSDNGTVIATMGTEIALWQIQNSLESSSNGLVQAISIMDADGNIIQQIGVASPPGMSLTDGNIEPPIDLAYRNFASTGEAVYQEISVKGQNSQTEYMLVHLNRFSLSSLNWLIGIRVLQDDLINKLIDGQKRILWIGAIALLLIVPFAFILARYIHRPLVAFSDATREIADGGTNDPVFLRAPFRELETTERALTNEINQRRNFQTAYERTFAVSSRGMARIDLSGLQFIHVNDRLVKMLNRDRDSLMQVDLWEIFGSENRSKVEGLVAALLEDREYSLDILFPVSASRSIWIKVSGLVIRDHGGSPNHALVIFDDIDEARQASERLEKLKNDLHHVGRVNMMGQFAAGLAHELNQPLSAIMHDIDSALFLVSKPDSSSKEVAQVLRDISSHAERSGKIIRALRNFIQKDRGGAESFPLEELLDQTKAIMEPDLKAYAAHLDTQIPPGTMILGKSSQIAQVLLNLIRNALEASVKDASNVCVVTIKATLKDDKVIIHVEDNGPGIPAHVRPFAQFESTRPGGMGLGLSICKSLVEANDGSVHYEVIAPRGARFVVELPADTAKNKDKSL